ncbi:MAG: S46 family peptidase [Planctomycetota bacterium]
MSTALFRSLLSALIVLGASALLTDRALAQNDLELGKMWTFENVPKDYFKQTHGFDLTQSWLDKVRLASLRFGGGCSASFVSGKGLVMTNHHCCRDFIAKASPENEDWVKDGFLASSMAKEVPLEGLTVQQLAAMKDITTAVNDGIADSDDGATITSKRKANQDVILEAARTNFPRLSHEIVKLYQGGMFQLYSYRIYDDIRLVVAPHLQTAHFGGDHDNFTYPRYGIDFTFCRAYEDGKPVDSSKNFFRWNSDGAESGDLVFVTGSPGSTGRLMTHAQLEYTRDILYPILLEGWDLQIADLKARSAKSADFEKEMRPRVLRLENSIKAVTGFLTGLRDPNLMARKAEWEDALKKRLAGDPELSEKYLGAWDRLAEISQGMREVEPVQRLINGSMFGPAVQRAFTMTRQGLAEALKIPAQSSPEAKGLAMARFEMGLRWLGKGDPILSSFLGGKKPAQAYDAMAAASLFVDDDAMTKLADGGEDAIEASQDPALVLVRKIRKLMESVRERRGELRAAENVEKTRVGQAVFAVYGTSVAPDATFTLRLSDGIVSEYPCNGTIAPARTSFYGMYGRNVEFGNHHPFDLPQVWLDRQDKVDLSRSVNFVATNDIIGGNSGSPVIDAQARIVGLIFDGNIEMLPNRFLYRDDIPRSVSVHVAAIEEALTKIYDAKWVMQELRN